MIQFCISTGAISQNASSIGMGYAGHPPYVNDPTACDMKGLGPLPVGTYGIGPPENFPESVGMFAIPLTPQPENTMFGRSGFFVHGDNPAANQTASDGCIVTSRATRGIVAADQDATLVVVA